MFCDLKLCARFPGLAIPGPRNEPSGVARAVTFSCNEPPISYHCTPYIVPSHRIYRTICTSFIVPLRPLHGTIAPATLYHCTPTSYHCTPYVVPLYRLHRTIVPLVLHLLYLVYLHHRTTALSSLHHRTCTSHPRTCASYPLKTIIVPTSRLPLRAVLLKFDNSKTSFFLERLRNNKNPLYR